MKRWRLGLAIVLSLPAKPSFADGPLPAGKPAGVRTAQTVPGSAIVIGAAVIIAAAGFVASSHPYRIPGQASTTSTGH